MIINVVPARLGKNSRAGLNTKRQQYGIPVSEWNDAPLPRHVIKRYVDTFKVFQKHCSEDVSFNIHKDLKFYLTGTEV